MNGNQKGGWIELICGCMFSGKTEELVRRILDTRNPGEKVIVFKPLLDTRHEKMAIVSHKGSKIDAIAVGGSSELAAYVNEGVGMIAVDEVQFFDEGITDTLQSFANRGFRVVAAGLDVDFRGEPFGPMSALMPVSDYITKLHASCSVCGAPASRTQRLIAGSPAHYSDPLLLVGAGESYEPRCRLHHCVPGNKDKL